MKVNFSNLNQQIHIYKEIFIRKPLLCGKILSNGKRIKQRGSR